MKMILLTFLLFSPNYDLLTITFILKLYFYYIIHNASILRLIHINYLALFFLLFIVFIDKNKTADILLPAALSQNLIS